MPSLPPPLRSGDPITTIAPWSVKVIDYLRAITVRPSATVSVSTTANGTLLTAAGAGQQTVRAASAATPYGFLVRIVHNDEDGLDHVRVATGTAQAWGLEVQVFPAADLGPVVDGVSRVFPPSDPGPDMDEVRYAGFVYAELNIDGPDDTPYWSSELYFDSMADQDPDTEVWIPIAAIEGSAELGWTVTQLHWGNIVIPATTNAVDVQESSAGSAQ